MHKNVTVSKEISRVLADFRVVHNGYDEEDFLNVKPNKDNGYCCKIFGTMTKSQNPKNFFMQFQIELQK